MDILEKYKMVEFYNSIAVDNNDSTLSSTTSNQIKTSFGARLDWEVKSRMDEILYYEAELVK